MTNEELLERFQAGDEQAFEQLLEQNAGLLWYWVRRYLPMARAWIGESDLLQASRYGMWVAAKKWSNEGGGNYHTYARYWTRSFVQREAIGRPEHAKNAGEKSEVNLAVTDDGLVLDVHDARSDRARSEIDARIDVDALSVMRDAPLAMMHHGHDKTLDEIATAIRRSRESVRQRVAKALWRMGESYEPGLNQRQTLRRALAAHGKRKKRSA